jgi:hypothetical protein
MAEDYYGLGPCDEHTESQPAFTPEQAKIFFGQILEDQQNSIATILGIALNEIQRGIGINNRELKKFITKIETDITDRVTRQHDLLVPLITDLTTMLTSEITENQVSLNLVMDQLELDDKTIIQLLSGQQPQTPVGVPPLEPIPPVAPAPPITVIVTNPVEPPQPVEPQQPVVPPQQPVVITQTVYLQCQTTPPSGSVTTTNEYTSSVFDQSNTTYLIGGGGGGGTSPIKIPVQVNAGGGGGVTQSGGGSTEPSDLPPVDLDQPLAFIFSADDSYWKQSAISFYGDGLGQMVSQRTEADMFQWISQLNMSLFPGVWPELINGSSSSNS